MKTSLAKYAEKEYNFFTFIIDDEYILRMNKMQNEKQILLFFQKRFHLHGFRS